jgi:putative tryptophan/tyrosine transport system substrate-binding protein
MRRRELITLLGSAAATWPHAARAQQRLRIGYATTSVRNRPTWAAFEQRMRELGYVEGKSLTIDYAVLEGREEVGRYVSVFREMIESGADVLITTGEVALKAAMLVTDSLPVVMVSIDFDPIASGYVTNLARPGGNVTGVFLRQIELAVKRLELLEEAVPERLAATVFWDRRSVSQWEAVERAAASIGLRLAGIELRDAPYDYDRALNEAPPDHRGTLLAMMTPFLFSDRRRLVEWTLDRRIASFFGQREFADIGALMAYGASLPGMYRRAAEYVHRIAQGTRTTDLPIEQPTKFECVVNLKTAKAIGITLPTSILLRADEVIE